MNARDRGLDELLDKYRSKQSDQLRRFLNEVVRRALVRYQIPNGSDGFLETSQFRHDVDRFIPQEATQFAQEMKHARNVAYGLAYLGEAEAVGRALGKRTTVRLTHREHREDYDSHSILGEDLRHRCIIALSKIATKAQQSFLFSATHQESTAEMIERMIDSFPRFEMEKRPVRALKPLREADQDDVPRGTLIQGIIDDDVWRSLVDEYKAKFIPVNRSPSAIIDLDVGQPELEERAVWELEQALTDEFVSRVRAGQVDAASENGVTDFMWVAIIDDRTDECCVWRDGLLVSEIEKELDGKHQDDECDGTVPPIHPNCRCRLEPVTNQETVDRSPVDLSDFDEWLNGKPENT